MVPIPKSRWANLSSSDNFRAITISSILSKLLDVIILIKEEDKLCTSSLKFGFKHSSSTSLCTAMIQETISYYVHGGSNVYGLMLDASKAFDRVNYCKLFRVLIKRKLCPLYCRLLLNMYTQQKLRVKWNNTHSDYFNVSNGVKQGGVISPILFCIYIDGMLNELSASGVGCYMGGVFAGAFGYADDVKLLTPSLYALKKQVFICENYAAQYDVQFNGKKSLLIIYKCSKVKPPDPKLIVNNVVVPGVDEVVHLGHHLDEDIYKFNVSKCTSDFNKQCNMFLATYKRASSYIRNVLFHKYCTAFYGSQILPMFNNCMHELYTSWRIAVRKVWRLPWTTHCKLLPHIAGCMDIELWLSKRCINFIKMAADSSNVVVKTITNMGLNGTHSVIGSNMRAMRSRYNMDVNNVCKKWNTMCKNNCECIRVSNQIQELCNWRDRHDCTFLTRSECSTIIEYLCTS